MSVRRFSARSWNLWAGALALSLVSCVDARPEDPLGQTQFVSSNVPSSADYTAAAATGGGGRPSAPPVGASPVAGTGNVVPPPVGATPPPPAAAAAGSGAMPRAGAAAAPSGSMGAAGARPGSAGSTALAGMGGASVAAGAAAPATGQGMLTVDFKSVTSNGQYAPRNVGAVWIETSSGMFVKTLEKWGNVRANRLTAWNAASGGWGSFFGGGNTADMMDAVSRATLRSHEMHHDTWSMKDATGKVVPDGMYNIVIEVAEDERRAAPVGRAAFVKGPAPQMVNAPDMPPFSGLVLSYQP